MMMTFNEAAKKYNLSNASVLRNWVRRNKFKEGECWKSGKFWLVKEEAVKRVLDDDRRFKKKRDT